MTTQPISRRSFAAGLALAPFAALPAAAGAVPAAPMPGKSAGARDRASQGSARRCGCVSWRPSRDLADAEFAALEAVARAPCASDGELVAKLKYLLAEESRLEGRGPSMRHDFGAVLVAVDLNRGA